MALHVITIETASLGDRSYVVHDGSVALVVDPQRDIDRVLDAARDAGVEITHVLETHVHNDYVSGGLALARATGARLLHAAAESLAFDHVAITGGDRFEVGELDVEVLATPGHTHHHLSYIVRTDDDPPAVFTGGSMLYGTVGRTDLIGADETESLTRAQFRSAHRIADRLPDETRVYPTHGFGSFCSAANSDEESDGTLGCELKVNVSFTTDDEDDFVQRLVDGLTAYPRYYAHMDPLNRAGLGPADLSPPVEVDPAELGRRIHRGEWVVDLRARAAFAAEHLAGTIGIELADGFSNYLGWLLPWGMPITLLADTADEVAEAQRQLVRIGIDRPAGAATGGPDNWAPDHDRRSYPVIDFAGLAERVLDGNDPIVLDVRREDEFVAGHIDGAVNVPLDEVATRLDDVPAGVLHVHCASGFRASIAASLLDRAGRQVVLVDDDFDEAAQAGLPMTGR